MLSRIVKLIVSTIKIPSLSHPIAEMQKALVADEANKMETMVEWKARILGISLDDAI